MRYGLANSIVTLLLVSSAWSQIESPYSPEPCPALNDRTSGWLESLAYAPPEKARVLIGALVRVGSPAWPLLESGLDHRSYEVRLGAIEAIGVSEHPRATVLLDDFASDRDRTLNGRLLAVRSMGRTGKSVAIAPLVRFALGEETELQAPAVATLSGIRSPQAVEALLRIGDHSRAPIREKVVEALRRLTGVTRPGRSIEDWKRWWKLYRHRIEWVKEEG